VEFDELATEGETQSRPFRPLVGVTDLTELFKDRARILRRDDENRIMTVRGRLTPRPARSSQSVAPAPRSALRY
jgi:hypothetical protein